MAPRALDVVSRFANFERRAGNTDFARSLLRGLLDAAIQAGDPAAVEELAEANISFEDSIRSAARVHAGEAAPAAAAPDPSAATVTPIAVNEEPQLVQPLQAEPAFAGAAGDANGGCSENTNGCNAGVSNGKENSARNGEACDGDAPPGDKTVGAVSGNLNSAAAGPSVTPVATRSFLEPALQNFPAREGLWTQAVAEQESALPWGPERAQAVLEIYRRAITSTEPTEKEVSSTPGAGAPSAAPGAATEASTKPALPLRVREKFAAAALSAMDFYGTPDQIWEAMELVLGLLGETLQSNAGAKRPAASQWQSTAQPDAKHHAAAPVGAAAVSNVSHMHAAHAGVHGAHVHDPNAMAMYGHDPNAAAAAAAAAQQHQYYSGYDYSMYYQQQAAAQAAAYPLSLIHI